MSTPALYDDLTGEPVESPSDLDYDTVARCDSCDRIKQEGWMRHAAGATGRVCAVLFLCHECGGTQPAGKEKGNA